MAQISNQLATNYFLTLTLLISLSFTFEIKNSFNTSECINGTIEIETKSMMGEGSHNMELSKTNSIDCTATEIQEATFTIKSIRFEHKLSENGKKSYASSVETNTTEPMNYEDFHKNMTTLFSKNDVFFSKMGMEPKESGIHFVLEYFPENDAKEMYFKRLEESIPKANKKLMI